MAALPDKEDVQLTMSDDVGLLSGCSTVVELRSVEALAAAEAGDAANQGEARRKIGEKTAARNRERAAWDRVHGRQDPELFRTEILPFLGRVSAREIAEVTGVSENTVKSRMRYALEGLRKRLAELGVDGAWTDAERTAAG